MSQVMSSVGDTDALAAEYVLGTLDSDERAMAHGLLAEDEAFVAKVKLWERRLGELHLMVEPVEPEKKIWERIKAKMPEVRQVVEIKLPEPAVEAPAPVAAPRDSGAASGSGPCCNAGPGRRRILRDRSPRRRRPCPRRRTRLRPARWSRRRSARALRHRRRALGAGADRGRDAGPAGRRGGRGGSGVGHRPAAHPLAGVRGADDAGGLGAWPPCSRPGGSRPSACRRRCSRSS